MPRRNKNEDLDFEIHIDPSCADQRMGEASSNVSGRHSLSESLTEADQERVELKQQIIAQLGLGLDTMNDPITGKADDVGALGQDRMAEEEHNQVNDNNDIIESIETHAELDTAKPEVPHSVIEDQDSSMVSYGDESIDRSELDTDISESCRDSVQLSVVDEDERRTSGRTEALIQAAARNIVAQIESGRSRQTSESTLLTEDAANWVTYSAGSSTRSSTAEDAPRDREDYDSTAKEETTTTGVDDAADSSSHHENEDDVFSDHSPRSSVGSLSDNDFRKIEDAVSSRTESPRVSGFSQYDQEDDFVPTVRGTPRPPFRSPSSVKAMQLSSPPASVIGSPRSSKRSPLPTVSRLGSPRLSTQYSPKKTPPRFRKATPPLVLLHVTLLPLRWPWGDTLDNAQSDDLSREGKTLREAWRELQDRMGDTTLERGILLPHPQNDYEILEERLLEALELPLRRRARILECGHYLGPANEMSLMDDAESDEEMDFSDERTPSSPSKKTHWCSTCLSEIRYDSLGSGRIFRVKVYASNGLMRAGAWDTCWKEMERVDVEIEPLVESAVHSELGRLAAEQERAMELHGNDALEEHDEEHFSHHSPMERHLLSPSPERNISQAACTPRDEERRRRDEERLREIYGGTVSTLPEPEPTTDAGTSPSQEYASPQTPPSPSVRAFERRQERRQANKKAGLPELMFEAVRILMQDKKNVAIAFMGVLVMLLAMRGGTSEGVVPAFDALESEPQTITVTETPVMETEKSAPTMTMVGEASSAETMDPCETNGSAGEQNVVRIVETVTETARETATITQTATKQEIETPALAMEEEDEDGLSGPVNKFVEISEKMGELENMSGEEVASAHEVEGTAGEDTHGEL